ESWRTCAGGWPTSSGGSTLFPRSGRPEELATPGAAEAATPRRLDAEAVARFGGERRLGGDAACSPILYDPVASRGARSAAGEPVGRYPSPLGEERHLRRHEELDLAHHAVAAPVASAAARPAPHGIAPDPQRIVRLEGLDRRVHGVRHVGVHGGEARPVRAGAGPARERLVVREA